MDKLRWIEDKPLLWLTLKEFNAMDEYSTTLPTGTIIGKRWKRQLYAGPHRGRWIIGEYVEDFEPGYVGIKWYRVACAGDVLPVVESGGTPIKIIDAILAEREYVSRLMNVVLGDN